MRMKNFVLLAMVLTVAVSCSSNPKKDTQDTSTIEIKTSNLQSTDPSLNDIIDMKKYIPDGFDIAEVMKFSKNKAFVFCIINNIEEYKEEDKNIMVFRFSSGKIDKIYKSENIEAYDLTLGFLGERTVLKNGLWGKMIEGYLLCPVTITGYNYDYYTVKMIAIDDKDEIIELEIYSDDIRISNNESISFNICITTNTECFKSWIYEVHKYTYETIQGIKLSDGDLKDNDWIVKEVNKIFKIENPTVISKDLYQKILRIYKSAPVELSLKYHYELQILINKLDKNPEVADYIDRMNKRLDFTNYVYGLPSIPLSWEESEIGTKNELIFTITNPVKKVLYDQLLPLLPKDRKIFDFKEYDTGQYSYVFVIIEGDRDKIPPEWFSAAPGRSLMLFVFMGENLKKHDYIISNTGEIEFYEENFLNRGDPYFEDYIDMDLWGMDFYGGKLFPFHDFQSYGNCWGCSNLYFLWIKDGETLEWKFEKNLFPDEYGYSVRGISFEDGELVCYRVLLGYEYFRGQSHAGSPKIHLLLGYRNGTFCEVTKEHQRFVDNEIYSTQNYRPMSAIVKIDVLATVTGTIDKYWPMIDQIAKSSKDDQVKEYFRELRESHKR